MKLNFRKSLLAGTALMAVGALAVSNPAQAADQTLTANATWASAGGATGADLANAAASDNVDVDTYTLTVTNDGTADDGSADTNTFVLGTVTDTDTAAAGTGSVNFVAGSANNATATFTAVTLGGGFAVTGADATDANLAATVTGDLTTGTTLVVLSDGDTQANTSSLSVGGDLTVGTTTAVTAGAFNGASTASLDVTGNATFTGAVTVTGGAGGAAADSTVTLSGATNTFTGGLTLTDGAAGQAILTLDGTTAQTVSGNIAGTGDLNVNNALGATFSGTVGAGTNAVVIENSAALNSAATFQNTTNVASITLGAAGTGTNTVTFDTSTQAFTVTGTVDGAIAAEANNVVVSGGDVLTTATAWGGVAGEIDLITISGTGTTLLQGAVAITATDISVEGTSILDSNDAVTANIAVASGATLNQGAGTITGDIANSGTILQSGTGAITGAITGTGALDIDAAATYTGAVTQATADIAAVALTLADGTDGYTVGTTTFSAAGTLAIGDGSRTITGNFTNTTDGEGTVTIADGAGTTTIVGNLGASADHSLAALTMGTAATAQTVTTTGDLYVDAITLDSDDTLQFLGTSAQTVSGTIAGRGAGEGILTVGNGTTTSDVTFSGAVGGTTLASAGVSAAATARFNANTEVAGALTNAGVIHVGTGATLTSGSYVDGTGTIVLGLTDANQTLAAADFGLLDLGGAATLDTDDVTINVSGIIGAGTADVLTNAGDAFDEAKLMSDNSALYTFTAATDGTITAAQVATSSFTTTTANKNTADVLLAVAGTATGNLDTIADNFAAAGAGSAVNEVLEAAASTVDGGAVVASMGVSNQSASIANTRMAALRSGNTVTTGMSAGNAASGAQYWGQAFGVTADQDQRDGVDGYDANTYGIAVGMETEALSDNMAVGVALTYATTDVDSENATTTNTEVDSIQLTVYGDYDLDDRTYISGQLGYSFNDNDTTRHNVGGVSGLTAKGNYDSNQISVRGEAGRSYAMESNLTLTPSVSLAYMNYDADTYTETGAGTANLLVDADSLNTLEVGVGVEAAWNLEQADGSVMKPSVHVGVRHDLIGDEFEANNTFTGGGTAFKTEGFDPAQTTFNGGVGVTYFSTNNWDLTANYDVEYKSDYVSHAGLLKAAYNF